MPIPHKLVFLPGAKGDASFWQPVAGLLPEFEAELVGWPWHVSSGSWADCANLDDLANGVAKRLDRPSALVAQSLGGAVAVLASLDRPQLVTHLVLVATSGGIFLGDLGIADWRPAFFTSNRHVPTWIADQTVDLSSELHRVQAPTLLLWGDADPISPVTVGRRLEAAIPRTQLHVVPGGDHDLAHVHAAHIAGLIAQHLSED